MNKAKRVERAIEGAGMAAEGAARRAEIALASASTVEAEVVAWANAAQDAIGKARQTCERGRKTIRDTVAKGADKRLADAKAAVHTLIREAVEAINTARDTALTEIQTATDALDTTAAQADASFTRMEAVREECQKAVHLCAGAQGSIKDAMTRFGVGVQPSVEANEAAQPDAPAN